MATAVAIAIRKEAAIGRLTGLLDAMTTAGGALPERPTQVHPDMREVVTLEWIGDCLEAMSAKPKKAKAVPDAQDEPETGATSDEG